MHLKRIQKTIAVGVLVLLFCAAAALGGLWLSIQSGLDKWCTVAQQSHPHPGDDVAALMAYVQSESHSLRDRNYAVWALGQARDARALPLLERYYTGQPCDHSRYLCQGELAKAIKLCQDPTPNPLFIRTPTARGSEHH
jgi:hypothetical protein